MNAASFRHSHACRLVIACFLFWAFAYSARAQNEPSLQGRTAAINGIDLYYEIHGQGPPLLLLHGYYQSGASGWSRYLTDFTENYQVILPDLRGHGRSTNPSKEFTHRQAALDVYALLDHLKIDSVQAMGISTGGMTLIHMATQQPSRVQRMVLIGATIYFPEQAREIMRKATVESMDDKMWERLRRDHKHGDEQIIALHERFNRFQDSYDDMNFTAPYLSTITAETLIVHGDRDAYFPVSIPVEMYRSIPNAYLWIVPNGQHVPIGQHAEEFTRLARQFLRGEWRGGK